MKKKALLNILLVCMIVFFIVLINYPINRKMVNLLIIGTFAFIVIYSVILFWRNKIISYGIIGVILLSGIMISLNGKEVDSDKLRSEYVESLKKYENVNYVWGGESPWGLDCSGLLRRSLFDVYIKVGLKNLSPQYIRKAFYLWYFDSSALALRNGYRGYTSTILEGITLNTLDHGRIKPGDMMVTKSGVHIMAYIGDSLWIQADPQHMKVMIEKAPSDNNMWYKMDGIIIRWEDLN